MAVDRESKVLGPEFKRQKPRKAPKVEKKIVETDDTVCVALNRPIGIKFPMPDGSMVEIKGNGEPLRGKDQGILTPGAYGLTIIKREQWEYILKTYGWQRIFTNGLCFACNKKVDAEAEAESRDDLRNGLEPVEVADLNNTQEAKGA